MVLTLNGIIVQIIMASRVLYGLAHQGELPAALAQVNRRTPTPLLATAAATYALVLVLALALPLHNLAEVTEAHIHRVRNRQYFADCYQAT